MAALSQWLSKANARIVKEPTRTTLSTQLTLPAKYLCAKIRLPYLFFWCPASLAACPAGERGRGQVYPIYTNKGRPCLQHP